MSPTLDPSGSRSIPHHVETLPLRFAPRVVGLLGGAALLALGLVLVRIERPWAQIPSALFVATGLITLAALWVFRSCELTVGTKRIQLQCGPLQSIVPTGAIESTQRRPATSWRRWYVDDELALAVSVGDGSAVLPTRDAVKLVEALEQLRASDG